MTYLLDLIAIAGALAIVAGVALIHIPSAFIVGGALALALVVSVVRREQGGES